MTTTNEENIEVEEIEVQPAEETEQGTEDVLVSDLDDDEDEDFDLREKKIASGEMTREEAYAGIGDDDFDDEELARIAGTPDDAFDEKPGRLPSRSMDFEEDDDNDEEAFDAKPAPMIRRMQDRAAKQHNQREVNNMSTENNDDVMVDFVKSVVALRGGIEQLCKLVAENTETLKAFKGEVMERLDEITDNSEYTSSQLVESSRLVERSVQTQRNVVENITCSMSENIKSVAEAVSNVKDIILETSGFCFADDCGCELCGMQDDEPVDSGDVQESPAEVEAPVVEKKPVEKEAPKPVAKKPEPKPAVKKEPPKPVAKKEAPKPVAKKEAPKPVAKKPEPKPAAAAAPGIVVYEEGWELKKDVTSLILRGNPKTGYTLSANANGHGFATTRKTGVAVADVKFTGVAPAGEWMVCVDRKGETYFLARKDKMQKTA